MCVTKSVVYERKDSKETDKSTTHSQTVKQHWIPFTYKLSQKVHVNLEVSYRCSLAYQKTYTVAKIIQMVTTWSLLLHEKSLLPYKHLRKAPP